ncbi:MAG: AMP-binding protein [Proteobacteria bacterium]|nr:AMP-binding protein [Pseudomonadota bacterium]MCP4918956.1 AMP-binding protein [Pseudomonadota bacterium]
MKRQGATFDSVVGMWEHRIRSTPDLDALYGRRDGSWYSLTWRQCDERMRHIACGLFARGMKTEVAAIACSTRPEWILADMAVLHTGGATTTLYPSAPLTDRLHILRDSGAVVCFVEHRAELDVLLAEDLPDIHTFVLIDGKSRGEERVIDLTHLEELGETWLADHPDAFDFLNVEPDDLATLMYTSGTTGLPKGVELTHGGWVFEGEAMEKLGFMNPGDVHFLYLPLAHSFAKVLALSSIRAGVPTACDGSVEDLDRNLRAIRPTLMAAVPRFFEKSWEMLREGALEGGPVKKTLFDTALETGLQVIARKERKEPIGAFLGARYKLADRMVFAPMRERFGGRIRLFICGAAPLEKKVVRRFFAARMPVFEGYGLTESSAASVVNRADGWRIGTVGRAMNGVTVRIADDGEILLGGRGLMRAYHNLPEETAQVLRDGWLHTGDLGRLDQDGYLTITGRRMDLVTLASGKRVAPRKMEARMQRAPGVIRAVVFGDGQEACVALIQAADEATDADIQASVDRTNADGTPLQRIARWARLPEPLRVEHGTLTPTRKLKRRAIALRYADLIESLYRS